MVKFDIDKTEYATMHGLKDFQRATVERIDTLFRNGQKRVLVADEVGMGKTLIARGAIVKTARLRIEEKDDLFKVVYICSNISIANQNIRKLKVSDTARIEGVSDTRLSMQHLKITQQEKDPRLLEGYIQLIPLTPDTSFRLTNGGGTVQERALMFAVLRRMPQFRHRQKLLEKLFVFSANTAWDSWAKKWYEHQVVECEEKTGGRYPADLIEKIQKFNEQEHTIDMLEKHIKERRYNKSKHSDSFVLNKLRVMFARISAQMLKPDLVIMDEFQRFKFLIDSNGETETGILANQFLNSESTRILLLSATPYKLYSTLEEIDDASGVDEHYREFLQVMDFLFTDSRQQFRKVWSDYNIALHEMKNGDSAIIQIKKNAEDAMYAGVCRTERISVMESGDYTDDSSVKQPIKVSGEDILSYIAMGKLLKEMNANFSLPIDYAKSSPYLLSYMKNYKIKEQIEKYFKAHKEEIALASDKILWVDPKKVYDYQPLPKTNARLEKLKEIAFEGHAERYLWIPPSKPYYELQGVYRDSRHFSKILVFSSWEMVPRMIGSMISYEAERLTVGKVCENAGNIGRQNTNYYAKTRYPYQRLRFTLSGGEPQRMTLFTLLYPSRTLAQMYQPIQAMNDKWNLTDIERELRQQVREKLKSLKIYRKISNRNEDARWYYLAPMLMDGKEYVTAWIDIMKQAMNNAGEDGEDGISSDRGNKAFLGHIHRLEGLIGLGNELSLGGMPEDLVNTIVDMILGSPAVCIYRSNGGNMSYATALAKTFVNYFNSTESTAIVQLAAEIHHKKKSDDNAHWQDVLLYCKDGCFQAMFDEYLHLIKEATDFSTGDSQQEQIQKTMLQDLRVHTASYDVDTYQNFVKKINGEKATNLMRAHYAVGFVSNDGVDNVKNANRKDSIRGAFNSPLKPFVLATTSIGQEGLDFHNYCRKIMHWNLPSNPIDLEQREGRINRFKCLAIRQNVADKYGSITFQKDPWTEMFDAATAERTEGQSELVPFWCFGKNQKIKIERIVPMYPMSKDEIKYERLIKILSLYRLTLGQARQEELLECLFKECQDLDELKELFIDLSPFSKKG